MPYNNIYLEWVNPFTAAVTYMSHSRDETRDLKSESRLHENEKTLHADETRSCRIPKMCRVLFIKNPRLNRVYPVVKVLNQLLGSACSDTRSDYKVII